MIEQLKNSVIELQAWGWNWLTFSFIVTILFDVAEAWAVNTQRLSIKREPELRAQSLSVKWFVYFGSLLIVLGCYGAQDEAGRISLAMIGEGILGISFYIPIVLVLRKVKGFSKSDSWVLVVSLLMIPAVIFLPHKEVWVTVFSAGAIFALATMPWEIWRNRSRGQVEIRLVWIYLANVGFWMLYGFTAHVVPLMIVTPVGVGLLMLTLALWFLYPARRSAPLG